MNHSYILELYHPLGLPHFPLRKNLGEIHPDSAPGLRPDSGRGLPAAQAFALRQPGLLQRDLEDLHKRVGYGLEPRGNPGRTEKKTAKKCGVHRLTMEHADVVGLRKMRISEGFNH